MSKYIWVIAQESVPFVKECGPACLFKHTNLTGGEKAYCGGEVWFASAERLYLNGGSGRYPCEDNEDLLESVTNFYLDIGYAVAVPPANEDNGVRPRVFKSEAMVEWLTHGG